MNIVAAPQINFCANVPSKKLIPLSKYKGPVLKLTEKDNTEIEKLREKLAEKEVEYYKLLNFYTNVIKKGHPALLDKIWTLRQTIDDIKEEIQSIKIARFEKQKKIFNVEENV